MVYQQLAVTWRDEVANVRLHQTPRQRPVDRFVQESAVLRPLPGFTFDTAEVVPAIVSSHARVHFDGNRYSVPPKLQNTTVMIRASDTQVRVIASGEVGASHSRSYDRNQRIILPDHRLKALKLRSRVRAHDIEAAFDALGDEARKFHVDVPDFSEASKLTATEFRELGMSLASQLPVEAMTAMLPDHSNTVNKSHLINIPAQPQLCCCPG